MTSRPHLLAALALAALASPAIAQSYDPAGGAPLPLDLDEDWIDPEPPAAFRRPPPIEIDVPPPLPVARPSGELVVNGGFEAPALAPGSWDVFGRVPGWMRSSGPGIELQRGVAGAPFEGAQHIELDSHGTSSMFQWLSTTPGATYLVTYRVSPRPGVAADDNLLEVSWDGDVIDTYASDRVVGETEWELRAVLVTATSRSTRLELADTSESDGLGAYVDDVSVRLVGRAPAPRPPVHRPRPWPSHWRGFAKAP